MATSLSLPLVVILGQTASGKTSFAVQLAQAIGGEIICADSRTVYLGMDIGTAKPSKLDQEKVKHHLIDIVKPDQTFSVAEFKKLAEAAIDDITSRGKIPILVGGSGLYINSVIYNYQFRETKTVGESLSDLSVPEMQSQILELGLELPFNKFNPRHLSKILLTKQNSPSNNKLRDNTIVVGLNISKEKLLQNITSRTNLMIEQGLVEELKVLVKKYDYTLNSFMAPSYQGIMGYIDGDNDLDKSIAKIISADLRLAKKQATWFKRNKSIHWLDDPKEYVATTTTLLSKLISPK